MNTIPYFHEAQQYWFYLYTKDYMDKSTESHLIPIIPNHSTIFDAFPPSIPNNSAKRAKADIIITYNQTGKSWGRTPWGRTAQFGFSRRCRGLASVPQTCRATAKPLRVSSRSLSPFGLEILTSQLNGGRSKRKTLYFY